MHWYPIRSLAGALALVLILLMARSALAESTTPLRFFAVGDLPYAASEWAPLRELFTTAVAGQTSWLVHLGDIKGGSQPCTDAQLREIADLFRAQPVPVVYAVGDNEWTDCHRRSAGRLNPRERLGQVRAIFFADPDVLRLGTLDVVQASPDYPEIYRFWRQGVLFVVLHVVGSDNGDRAGDPEAVAEFQQRDAVNRDFLRRSADLARQRDAQAMVVLFHADPLFEQARTPRGYVTIRQALLQLMEEYAGPVLLIHGDTHYFRHDHPLKDPKTGRAFDRFVRVEVPGSPLLGAVWITHDPQADDPFGIDEVRSVASDFLGPLR